METRDNIVNNYIDFLKSGNKIKIKKKNIGSFTRYCNGKVTTECIQRGKNSPSATIRKRATFAQNARSWSKHEEGGILHVQTGAKVNLSYQTLTKKTEDTEEIKLQNPEEETTKTVTSETSQPEETNWWEAKAQHYLQMSGGVQQTVTQDPETGVYSQSGYSQPVATDKRGFRNNNWLNIRISNNNWQGKRANNTDGEFEQFETPELGIRAATRNIRTYGKRGLQTVNDIISTWAPASENNTASYIQNVASRMGVDPNQTLDLNDTDTMVKLISAMTISENGRAGDESIIRRGVEMA